jgi:hypothetical protein
MAPFDESADPPARSMCTIGMSQPISGTISEYVIGGS